MLEDGARRPPSYFKIPWLLFILGVVIIKQVTLVGRWPPCHVLQQHKQQRNNITNTICKGNNVVRYCSVVVYVVVQYCRVVVQRCRIIVLRCRVIVQYCSLSDIVLTSSHPQNCINMQNGGRTDFNLTKVKIVIICKQIQWRCLHFSKLIPFVCKTLGFTS